MTVTISGSSSTGTSTDTSTDTETVGSGKSGGKGTGKNTTKGKGAEEGKTFGKGPDTGDKRPHTYNITVNSTGQSGHAVDGNGKKGLDAKKSILKKTLKKIK